MSIIILCVLPTKLLVPFIINRVIIDEKNLPLPGWQFYDISSVKVFWLTYFYQAAFVANICFATTAHDSVFSGLLLHVCAQASIVKHRLVSLVELKKEMQYKQLALIVNQHISIYRL